MPLPEATKYCRLAGWRPITRDDRTLAQEQVGQADGLLEHAAGVAAQIEDDPGEPVARLPLQSGQRLHDPHCRPVIEAMHPDHANIAIARCGYGRLENRGALQPQFARLRHAGRHYLDRDRAADRPAQAVDDLVMHAPVRRDAIDRDDLVLRANSGAVGRALRFDGGDAERILRAVDRNPDPAPAVAGRSLVARQLGRRVSREAVEASRHPVHHRFFHRLGRQRRKLRRGPSTGGNDRIHCRCPACGVGFRRSRIESQAAVVIAQHERATPDFFCDRELPVEPRQLDHAGYRDPVGRHRFQVIGADIVEHLRYEPVAISGGTPAVGLAVVPERGCCEPQEAAPKIGKGWRPELPFAANRYTAAFESLPLPPVFRSALLFGKL